MTLPEWSWEQLASGAENSGRSEHLSVLEVGRKEEEEEGRIVN